MDKIFPIDLAVTYFNCRPEAVTDADTGTHLDAVLMHRLSLKLTVSKADCVDAFFLVLGERRRTMVEEANALPYQPTTLSFGDLLARDSSQAAAIDLVLRHWIWSVRRKIARLPVEKHVMPILTGKTGSGKTEALRKFIGALLPSFCSSNFSLEELEDGRGIAGCARRHIQFFDEMDGARKVQIETLKRWITALTCTYRPMNSNAMADVIQAGMAIGAANDPLVEILHDDTGMRRFYEIEVKDKLDWDAINRFDFKAYWGGVDYKDASPLSGRWELMSGPNAFENTVEQWLKDDFPEIPWPVRTKPLHEDYARWCRAGHRRNLSPKAFSQALLQIVGDKDPTVVFMSGNSRKWNLGNWAAPWREGRPPDSAGPDAEERF